MKNGILSGMRTIYRRYLRTATALLAMLFFLHQQAAVNADATYFPLVPGTPLSQNWTNVALITTDDNWAGVPSIIGYRGDDLTTVTATDPQTILADGAATPVDVIANQTNPNTQATGGVAEFDGIANPSVALQGSGTADAPFIDIRLDTTGCTAPANRINVSYNLRDLDGSADNAVQAVALHYRVGAAGSYTNVPGGFVADATTGPNQATLVTPIALILPAATQGQTQVHLRIMTTNAVGNDEWVGVDDLNIACNLAVAAGASIGGQIRTASDIGVPKTTVTLSGGDLPAPVTALTNGFGYYKFEDLPVGGTYVLTVASKRYTFDNPTRLITLNESLDSENFTTNEP